MEMLFSSFIYFLNKNSTNKGDLPNETQSQALKYQKTRDRREEQDTHTDCERQESSSSLTFRTLRLFFYFYYLFFFTNVYIHNSHSTDEKVKQWY